MLYKFIDRDIEIMVKEIGGQMPKTMVGDQAMSSKKRDSAASKNL
jgi:hypothetical protein